MKNHHFGIAMIAVLMFFLPVIAVASDGATGAIPDLTTGMLGMLAVVFFIAAYLIVIAEEFTHLRKSKPVIVGAGLIWILVAIAYAGAGQAEIAEKLLRANLLEYAELMLFLLSAMTYINTMQERNVFKALRSWLVTSGFSLRSIFWLTGVLAFFISPVADNLTTSLLMVAVVLAVAGDNPKFVAVACVNIVVAANAGGAFSPFGDITTLMVWQKGVLSFFEFFALFVPSLINWLIPAFLMAFTVGKSKPAGSQEIIEVKYGGYVVIGLFLLTITLTVSLHQFLHLPPFLGMMTGLGILKFYGYVLRRNELRGPSVVSDLSTVSLEIPVGHKPAVKPFDIFISLKRAEWDTLLFFYGVVLCVGGLGAFGYLAMLSHAMYGGLGATTANVLVGIASAIIDNIPIMFAVLNMNPQMPDGQWLLVTLTTGVGGSLLSIGSAAGVALMGQARGNYTFFGHLKWTWAIALGYAASIWVHFLINRNLF